jgi:cysteine desulfurase
MTSSGVDLLSISAHKFGGPKGVGALAIRRGMKFEPILRGGGQESGRRSGTENTAGIVGMGKAAELASRWLSEANGERLAKHRDSLENEILSRLAGVTVNGAKAPRLPNTSHLSFDGCDAAGLLILLEECGIACSAGSSCMSGKQKPSHVQIAMGIPEARAKSSLRLGLLRDIADQEILQIADSVVRSVEKLRRVQGHGMGPVAVYSAPERSH